MSQSLLSSPSSLRVIDPGRFDDVRSFLQYQLPRMQSKSSSAAIGRTEYQQRVGALVSHVVVLALSNPEQHGQLGRIVVVVKKKSP